MQTVTITDKVRIVKAALSVEFTGKPSHDDIVHTAYKWLVGDKGNGSKVESLDEFRKILEMVKAELNNGE